MKYFDHILPNTSFRMQLIIIFGLGLLTLTIVSTMVISTLSSHSIEERMIDEGNSLTTTLAAQSTLALLYESEDAALDNIKIILNFPDVKAAEILDASLISLASSGEKLRAITDDYRDHTILVLIHEDNLYWEFLSPVYSGNIETTDNPFDDTTEDKALLGYVRLVIRVSNVALGRSQLLM